jgi:hypothetical protein
MHCALAGIPGAITYRTDALTYWLGRLLVKVDYLRRRQPDPPRADVPGVHPRRGAPGGARRRIVREPQRSGSSAKTAAQARRLREVLGGPAAMRPAGAADWLARQMASSRRPPGQGHAGQAGRRGNSHGQSVTRPQGHSAEGFDGMILPESELPVAADHREQHHGLHQPEILPEADARTRPEGDVGEPINLVGARRHEALGIEVVRIIPVEAVTVEDPGGNGHERAPGNLGARDFVIRDRLTGKDMHWRIEAERLLDHRHACKSADRSPPSSAGAIRAPGELPRRGGPPRQDGALAASRPS